MALQLADKVARVTIYQRSPESFLAIEVVIEGTLRYANPLEHFVDARRREPLLGEHLKPGAKQELARFERVFGPLWRAATFAELGMLYVHAHILDRSSHLIQALPLITPLESTRLERPQRGDCYRSFPKDECQLRVEYVFTR